MSVSFSVVTTVFETWHFLPRVVACLLQQTHPDWELLIVVDGPAPPGPGHPRRLVHQLHRQQPERRVEYFELPRAAGCWGNVARRFALDHARGDYVCWINHDNLVAPAYLATHAANIERRPGCLSVVDIDLWNDARRLGRCPTRYALSHIDLLCYALPLATARAINAFGGPAAPIYHADWLTFEAAAKVLPIEHTHAIVGTHF